MRLARACTCSNACGHVQARGLGSEHGTAMAFLSRELHVLSMTWQIYGSQQGGHTADAAVAARRRLTQAESQSQASAMAGPASSRDAAAELLVSQPTLTVTSRDTNALRSWSLGMLVWCSANPCLEA